MALSHKILTKSDIIYIRPVRDFREYVHQMSILKKSNKGETVVGLIEKRLGLAVEGGNGVGKQNKMLVVVDNVSHGREMQAQCEGACFVAVVVPLSSPQVCEAVARFVQNYEPKNESASSLSLLIKDLEQELKTQ
jgi:hypothetical protein